MHFLGQFILSPHHQLRTEKRQDFTPSLTRITDTTSSLLEAPAPQGSSPAVNMAGTSLCGDEEDVSELLRCLAARLTSTERYHRYRGNTGSW
jgi:hypothetical protein